MTTPTNRTPVRIARGTAANLTSSISDIQEGEIVWDQTDNKLRIRGTDTTTNPPTAVFFEHITASDPAKADLTGATFTGDVKVESAVVGGIVTSKKLIFDDGANDDYNPGGFEISYKGAGNLSTYGSNNINFETDTGNILFQSDMSGSGANMAAFNAGGACQLYYDGDVAFETNSSGIQVEANNTVIPGLQAALNVGSSGNCRIEAYSDNGNNSAEDNNTFKIYSQHGTDNTTKTSILYESFYDQVWRVKGEGGSGCSGISHAELGRINHDGGWELRYHDVQGTAPNWTGTTCDKKLETTADGVTITGNLIVNGTTTEISSTTLTVDDKNIELGKGTGSVTTGQTATLALNTNVVTVASTVGYLPGAVISNVSGTGAFGDTSPNSCFVKEINSSTEFTIGDGAGNIRNHSAAGAITFDVGAASDLTANGGGITLKGSTDKTILWSDTTDSWEFNQPIRDTKGDVRTIPVTTKPSAYAPTDRTDVGKAIYIDAGGVTIDQNIFSTGDAVTIINNSAADQTITQGTGVTLHNAADAQTGNRTLAGRGMATIWFAAANTAYISGAGLS